MKKNASSGSMGSGKGQHGQFDDFDSFQNSTGGQKFALNFYNLTLEIYGIKFKNLEKLFAIYFYLIILLLN
jgi:hypothetical protein